MKKKIAMVCFCLSLYLPGSAQQPLFQTRERFHPAMGWQHMVSTQEEKATRVASDILKHGGNAVDAAVAAGFVMAVTLPRAGNIGGGGFMMYWDNQSKQAYALDYRETAPTRATVKEFVDESGNILEDRLRWGYASAGVPGTVRGLLTAHRKWGRLPLRAIMQPAINFASHGFLVTEGLSNAIKSSSRNIKRDKEARRIFLKPNGKYYEMGEWIIQKDLGHSLKLIAEQGEKAFYEGEIAKKIVKAMKANNGLMSLDDLKNYQAKFRKPIKTVFRDKIVYSMPPPSSGGITLVEMLNILNELSFKHIKPNTAHYFHLLAEVMNFAYNDRNSEIGDPDFVSIPRKRLLSKKHAQKLAIEINLKQHTPAKEVARVMSLPDESPETTHFSIIDRDGNMVSNTYTLNYTFGSGHVVPGTGIVLNNELDDFTIQSGIPNIYGLVQGDKNLLKPKKRPLSSMTPTLVINEDKTPFAALGSPGGSQIITAVLQVLLHVIDDKMNIASSVAVPRIHSQLWPDKIFLEQGVSRDTAKILKSRGHQIARTNAIGSIQIILKQDGKVQGYSDPRRRGAFSLGK